MAEKSKPWKLVVVGVAFKFTPQGVRVMTNRRKVQNPQYDPLYNGTWEAMGETVEPGENIFEALIRGFREECGVPDFKPEIYGMGGKIWFSTGKGDSVQCLKPLCYLHNMGLPQPWSGPAFALQVRPDFEPNFNLADGEANAVKWWDPSELGKAIERNPQSFMGWHMPALLKLCERLIRGGWNLVKL